MYTFQSAFSRINMIFGLRENFIHAFLYDIVYNLHMYKWPCKICIISTQPRSNDLFFQILFGCYKLIQAVWSLRWRRMKALDLHWILKTIIWVIDGLKLNTFDYGTLPSHPTGLPYKVGQAIRVFYSESTELRPIKTFLDTILTIKIQ